MRGRFRFRPGAGGRPRSSPRHGSCSRNLTRRSCARSGRRRIPWASPLKKLGRRHMNMPSGPGGASRQV
eukprot:1657613-Pyramimonas_sp.AAC.1